MALVLVRGQVAVALLLMAQPRRLETVEMAEHRVAVEAAAAEV
jgi:hypothetical protein